MNIHERSPTNEISSNYALLRVILIDSYTEGRITELPIAGNTAITGRNGRGKTSLLRLIPAFYGERLDRIVKPVSNQKNFARYYLPRATSYIVYEYQREDGVCCAILCADQTGDGVEYRFANNPYHREWFVHDDEATLVASSNLVERLKLSGVGCTRKMSLDQFRAIIQGKRVHGTDLKQHRRDIAAYAISPPNQSLQHIERIVFGMFMRKTNFTDLQRMIVSTVTEARGNVSLGTERKKVENWPDAYQSYADVMAEEHRMEGILNTYNAILAAELELRNIHGRFHVFDCALDNEQLAKRDEHNSEQQKLEAAEEEFGASRRSIVEKVDQAGRSINAAAGYLKQLDEQRESFTQQEVESKAALLDQEEEINQAKSSCQERRSLLLSKQKDIDDEYRKILDRLQIENGERVVEFERHRSDARKAHQARVEKAGLDYEQQEAHTRSAAIETAQRLDTAVALASTALGEAKSRLSHPQPDAELVQIAEQQYLKVEDARAKLQGAVALEESARKAYDSARDTFTRGENMIRATQDQLNAAERELDSLLKYTVPDEGSVLYALRSTHPSWTQDIGKVLRTDILMRTDLSPVIGEIQDSIYGLRIDLDLLETPIAANEAALQEKIDLIRSAIKNHKDRLAQQQAMLIQYSADRQATENAKSCKSAEAATARTSLTSIEKQLAGARLNVQHSREAALKKAQQEHAEALTYREEAQRRVSEHRAILEQSIVVLRSQRDQHKTQSQQELDNALEKILESETEAGRRYEQACAQVKLERSVKLEANGVDTAALHSLELQISEITRQLKIIHDSRNLVLGWRRWLDSEWSQRANHERELAAAQKDMVTYEEMRSACTKRWHEDSTARKRTIKDIKQQLDEIATQRGYVAEHRKVLDRYPLDIDALPELDAAWNINSLVGQTSEQLSSLKTCESRLQHDIGAIKRAFTASRHSPTDQYYDTQRQAIGPDRADRPREWVPAFKAWYSSEHLQFQNLLRVDAKTIAEAVGDFRDRMNAFHLKVQQFNRELQESLNSNQGFESIGSLSVQIVSSIRELAYWSTIEKVVEARRDWMTSDVIHLPPPEFATALRELLSHWQLKEGIEAELTSLVRIQGEVVENGNRRPFRKAEDLETISSNGLSYIVMVLIFVGFINRVRGKASVNVVWALDEIKDLDIGNVELLMDILAKNRITLVSACPDPDPDVLALFQNRRSIRADRFIYDPSTVSHKTVHTSAPIPEEETSV